MRSLGVVLDSPRFSRLSRLLQRREPVLVQTLVSKSGVEAFSKGIVSRLTEARELQLDPVLIRPGIEHLRDEWSAYLWTKGYTPRLRTYAGREVPKPLRIDICRGKAPMETVLADILALTKLNYNACIFADGVPVTLKFADAVGEILTAGPLKGEAPLPFKLYI